MREIITLNLKARFGKTNITDMWRRFHELRNEDPYAEFYWLGDHKDHMTQEVRSIWIKIRKDNQEEKATMFIGGLDNS